MLNSKAFWYVNMAACSVLWIFVVYGIVSPFQDKIMFIVWLGSLISIAIGHPIELKRFMPIAKEKGIPTMTTVVMVMILGFTWWLPVKKGVFYK